MYIAPAARIQRKPNSWSAPYIPRENNKWVTGSTPLKPKERKTFARTCRPVDFRYSELMITYADAATKV